MQRQGFPQWADPGFRQDRDETTEAHREKRASPAPRPQLRWTMCRRPGRPRGSRRQEPARLPPRRPRRHENCSERFHCGTIRAPFRIGCHSCLDCRHRRWRKSGIVAAKLKLNVHLLKICEFRMHKTHDGQGELPIASGQDMTYISDTAAHKKLGACHSPHVRPFRSLPCSSPASLPRSSPTCAIAKPSANCRSFPIANLTIWASCAATSSTSRVIIPQLEASEIGSRPGERVKKTRRERVFLRPCRKRSKITVKRRYL